MLINKFSMFSSPLFQGYSWSILNRIQLNIINFFSVLFFICFSGEEMQYIRLKPDRILSNIQLLVSLSDFTKCYRKKTNWAKYVWFYKNPLQFFFMMLREKAKQKQKNPYPKCDWSGRSSSNILKTVEGHGWEGK